MACPHGDNQYEAVDVLENQSVVGVFGKINAHYIECLGFIVADI